MLIAHIIPLVRLPRSMDFFDYSVPDELTEEIRIGCFVTIPFRTHSVAGLVASIEEGDTAKLKSITRLLPLAYTNAEQQLAFFHWFATTYYVSRSTALKTLLPAFPKIFLAGKKRRDRTDSPPAHHEYGALPLSPLPLLSLPLSTPVTLYSPNTLQEKWSLYLSLIKEALSKKQRILIVFPAIHEAELFYSHIARAGEPVRTILLHSQLSEGVIFDRWLALFSDEPACIIGTRTALCTPLRSLETIIVDKAEEVDHIQYDMNPRFDSRRSVVQMGRCASVRVLLCSPAPRIEECMLVKRITGTGEQPTSIMLVNLHDELRNHPADIFVTEPLIAAIKQCLLTKRGVFLFCNRTGSGSMAMCNDCGYIFSCLICATPLKPFSHPVRLVCDTCKTSEPLKQRCPYCSSVRLAFKGLGIEKIAENFKRLFPNTPIHELSAKESDSAFVRALHTPEGRDRQAIADSIVIGTSYALSACSEIFSDIGLVGIIHADPILSVNDFRTQEHQWQTVAQLTYFARSFGARLLIQAFDPSNHFIKTCVDNDYDAFVDSELIQRKKNGWPPHTKSIHLLYRPNPRVTTQEKRKSINEVIGYLTSPAKDPRCSLFLHRPMQAGKQSSIYEVVIRIAKENGQDDIPPTLREYLSHLPNDWIVDAEPLFF